MKNAEALWEIRDEHSNNHRLENRRRMRLPTVEVHQQKTEESPYGDRQTSKMCKATIENPLDRSCDSIDL